MSTSGVEAGVEIKYTKISWLEFSIKSSRDEIIYVLVRPAKYFEP